MVSHYRALNKITIPDASPIPLINETIDQVAGAQVFSQIDLIWGYHQMRLREEDCDKNAIHTRYGSFEWRVLCFGLTNAPAAFSRLLAHIIRELHGECLVLYVDDILIYSKNKEEHMRHLRKLFQILRKNELYVRPRKSNFGATEVDYWGFKINSNGVHTRRKLVEAVENWPTPKSVKGVQKFMGLANFYRRFMKRFAHVARPITDLLRTKEKNSSGRRNSRVLLRN